MRLIKDSISDALWDNIDKELSYKSHYKSNEWQSSTEFWSPKLKVGIAGSCMVMPVSDTIQLSLSKELKSTLPEYDKLNCYYHMWQPQSGISWHNDSGGDRVFGATLYLNDTWHPNNGGWFIWKDSDGHHALLPERKTLVINNSYQWHCVTPVVSDFRYTIQIWGDKYK